MCIVKDVKQIGSGNVNWINLVQNRTNAEIL